MACIKITCWGDLWEALEKLEMAKAEVNKLKPTKGKDVKGGSTAVRKEVAKKVEKAMTKKGEKDQTKKSNVVNKVIASKVKK